MAVFESEREIAPRSALRYRPVNTGQAVPPPVVWRARRSRPDVVTTAAHAQPDELDPEEEAYPPPRRRLVTPSLRFPVARSWRRLHPLFFVGLGLLLTILLWMGITQAMAWVSNELNTLRFGYPRTFQLDAVVGHNDSAQRPSHFLALNLHGQILVIELPGGDPTKAREFVITTILGQNADLEPVTLRFIDLSKNGRPDMIIDIGGTPQSVLINVQGTFRPPTPAEQQQLLQELQ